MSGVVEESDAVISRGREDRASQSLGRKPISVDSKISEVPVSYLGLHGVMNYCPLQDPSDPQRNFSLYPSVMEGA